MKIFGIQFGKKEVSPVAQQEGEKFSFGYSNSSIKGDLSDPTIEYYRGNGPVYFGADNLFPQHINEMYNRSSLHSAIINFKKDLVAGGGFQLMGEELLTPSKKLELSQFVNYIDGENSLQDILNELVLDYLLHNTMYVKLYWNSDKSKIIKIDRIEPSTMRVGIDPENYEKVNKYYYSFDWEQYGRFGQKEYKPFNINNKVDKVDILRYMTPNPKLKWNTLPSYGAADNWINLDGDVSLYHKSNIENSINPSLIIKFPTMPASEEDKRKILLGLKKQKGAERTGDSMIFFGDGKENIPEVDTVNVSNIDKQFNVTADHIQRNICYAHRIDPIILGLKTPGSLGNGAELPYAYEIFTKSVIHPTQREVESFINKILRLKGLSVIFKFNENALWSGKSLTEK